MELKRHILSWHHPWGHVGYKFFLLLIELVKFFIVGQVLGCLPVRKILSGYSLKFLVIDHEKVRNVGDDYECLAL